MMVGRNSARGAARWGDMSLRLTRGFSFGVPRHGPNSQRGAAGAAGRRRWSSRRRWWRLSAGQQSFQSSRSSPQADNVLNRVNFTNYAGTMTSRLFGQPTASSQARRVQVGFQFRF